MRVDLVYIDILRGPITRSGDTGPWWSFLLPRDRLDIYNSKILDIKIDNSPFGQSEIRKIDISWMIEYTGYFFFM